MPTELRLVADNQDVRPSEPSAALPREPATVQPFCIGPWLVHPALNRIHRNGLKEQLEPRIMHVLVCLASRPGEVISRKELLETAWSDVVVGEEVLTRAISQLRLLFEDQARTPQYVETIRGSGYRLLVPVSAVNPGVAGGAALLPAERSTRPTFAALLSAARPWLLRLLLLVAVAIVAGALLWPDHQNAVGISSPRVPHEVTLTAHPNEEIHPAFSPNGVMVAFAANSRAAGYFDIYVKHRDSDVPLRLTQSPYLDAYPAWSPDGGTIAFSRYEHPEGSAAVSTVPATGGPVRRLFEVSVRIVGLSWSNDGEHLVFSGNRGNSTTMQLVRLNSRTFAHESLTDPPTVSNHPPEVVPGDTYPVHSPSGAHLAFVRTDKAGLSAILVIAASGGRPRRLTGGLDAVSGLAWTADEQHLIVAAASAGASLLWRVSVTDGSRTWLPTLQADAVSPAVDPTGRNLIYVRRTENFDIWRYRLFPGSKDEPLAEPLLASTKNESWPTLSWDGSQIAFVSNRSGQPQIWVSESEGRQPRQLTRLEHGRCLQLPRWSPDGTQIAFSAAEEDQVVIHLIDVATGATTRIPPDAPHCRIVDWSSDGRSLYYDVGRGEHWELRSRHLGSGTTTEIALPVPTVETIRLLNDDLYFTRSDEAGIWRWPMTGGEPQLVVTGDREERWVTWTATKVGFFFVPKHDHEDGEPTVELLDPETGTTRPTAMQYPTTATRIIFSRDGTTVLAAKLDRVDSDLIMIEDFAGSL